VIVWLTALLTNYLSLRALYRRAPPSPVYCSRLCSGSDHDLICGNIGIFEYMTRSCPRAYLHDETVAFSYGVLLHIVVFADNLCSVCSFLGAGLSQAACHYGSAEIMTNVTAKRRIYQRPCRRKDFTHSCYVKVHPVRLRTLCDWIIQLLRACSSV